MKGIGNYLDKIREEQDRRILLAIIIAIFGIILFIALALTLPYEGS